MFICLALRRQFILRNFNDVGGFGGHAKIALLKVAAMLNPYLCPLMKELIYKIKELIISAIDFFYPPFQKLMDKQTFRYAASGGSNTLLDITLYFISYNFILQKKFLPVGSFVISPHIAAFLLSFPVTFFTGFFMARYVVFPEAAGTKKRVQLTKYMSVVFVCILLNYGFLKLFVEVFVWWPLPAKLATTVFVVAFSYFSQKKFAFRHHAV